MGGSRPRRAALVIERRRREALEYPTVVDPQNSHAVAPALRAGERRIPRRRALWLLPLLVPGIIGGIAAPAQAAAPSSAKVVHATTTSKASVSKTSRRPAVVRARAVTARSKAMVRFAERFVGVPYRYGGTTRRGFDCSGFTQHVYAHFDIALPHSASKQGRMGRRISDGHARPGDLVVVDGGSHVGIYVSRGEFIDAPMPGRTIRVRPIYTRDFYIVRIR